MSANFENKKVIVDEIKSYAKDAKAIILVDYKTDSYNDPSEITKKYQKQLYYYELALRKRFKEKIIQKYLYLMHKNDIIEL